MRLIRHLSSPVMHKLVSTVVLTALGYACLAVGANAAAPQSAAAGRAQAELLSRFDAVNLGDHDAEREEIAYLRSISKPREVFINNLADELQLRFTLRGMKKAGRTPTNAPNLFATLANMRAQDLLHGPSKVKVLSAPPTGRQPLNIVTSVGQLANSAPTGGAKAATDLQSYSASGISSIPGGTQTTLSIIQLFDVATNLPIGPGASSQQYGGGEDLLVTQTSAHPSIANVGAMLQVTYQASPTTDPVSVTNYATVDVMPLAPPSVGAPRNTKGNAQTVVCLSRTVAEKICDYGPFEGNTGNPLVQLPVYGNITFPAPIDKQRAIVGTLIVWAKNGGGSCTLHLGPNQNFAQAFHVPEKKPTQLYWRFYYISPFGKQYEAIFGQLNNNPCWQPDQPYGMTLDVNVPLQGTLSLSEFFVTTTPGPAIGNATRIPPLNFTWGCFAEGTLVLMADGSAKPIEQVKSGDTLVSGANGRYLTVRQTTKGTESEPMVNITDAGGHHLSVTEGHAVPIASKNGSARVVLAKTLKTGDLLYTSDLAIDKTGKPTRFRTSKITQIERVKTAGYVYNVYLGTRGEHFGKDDTTLIAGGILTGDNAMQEYFGADFNFKPAEVKQRIAPEWHLDYDNFLKMTPADDSAGQAQEQL